MFAISDAQHHLPCSAVSSRNNVARTSGHGARITPATILLGALCHLLLCSTGCACSFDSLHFQQIHRRVVGEINRRYSRRRQRCWCMRMVPASQPCFLHSRPDAATVHIHLQACSADWSAHDRLTTSWSNCGYPHLRHHSATAMSVIHNDADTPCARLAVAAWAASACGWRIPGGCCHQAGFQPRICRSRWSSVCRS